MRITSLVGACCALALAAGCSSSSSPPHAGGASSTTGGTSAGGTNGSASTSSSGRSGPTTSSSPAPSASSAGSGSATSGAPGSAIADAGPDATIADAGESPFSFFVTSVGSGAQGGNLGGLTGADAKCQMLAAAVGAGSRTWHAYLSVSGASPVNARDRIGPGPWFNVRGVKIAEDIAQLHEEDGGMNNIGAATSLDEKGNPVPSVNAADAGTRNEHDILTGSDTSGRALPATPDRTCASWTSSTASGSGGTVPTAEVGHENRMGTNAPPASMSWNSSHTTPGCSQADLQSVGGAGRLYCFATD